MRSLRATPLLAFLVVAPSPASRGVAAFSPSPHAASATAARPRRRRAAAPLGSAVEAGLPLPLETTDEEDMEWVEEEFELLTERDFYNTEWKVGTLMENKPREAKSIDTTWVRLITTEGGENKCIWGDESDGKWALDVPSQFFSISKESFGGWLGKKIWAGTVDDFYFMEGTVRGWSPLSPASVVGNWQMIRLGVADGARVTEEERGAAPWVGREEGSAGGKEDGGAEDGEDEEGDGTARQA